jgi:glutathione S-transferase
MKLYFSPGACSLSPHIALREAGLPFEAIQVNLKTHQLNDGSDYYAINPHGSVPLLVLDNGEHLTEGPAIVQFIADQAPDKNLAPPNGTLPRYRLQSWLNFIGTELHKNFSPLFSPITPEETKAQSKAKLQDHLHWVNAQLEGRQHLLGESFSVADGYLFVVTNWCQMKAIDISALTHLNALRARVAARPAVQAAMRAEGLSG